ncbi:carbon storage regulator [Arthrobacter sp. MYb227]|uniref:carbon storage regulator CsrA n=1 Tax=Arthrobacter sp. MYb227 TaxID=1848601 RepID=UPI000CFCC882|nr:carbon storage regulator CsrA [Arthrobacter sp. MYb227]PQZ96463.1 carbon storage regulator [Arthrobacter sp. MYb227]
MLVLTRKVGEKILIGEDIVLTILEVRGDSIKVGIDAPRDVKIQRAEMVAAVTEANQEAAAAASAGSSTEARLKELFGNKPPTGN